MVIRSSFWKFYTLTQVDDDELHYLRDEWTLVPCKIMVYRLCPKDGEFLAFYLDFALYSDWLRLQLLLHILVSLNCIEEDGVELKVCAAL